MPRRMTFHQLEEELVHREGGVELSWLELKDFSEGLWEEIDMRIVAVDWGARVEFDTFLDSGFYVAIEARDSGEWEAWEGALEGFVGSLEMDFCK